MRLSPENSRRLAAARDLGAVLLFCAAVWSGGRAVLDSPHLRRERLTAREAERDIAEFFRQAAPHSPPAWRAREREALDEARSRLDEFGRLKVRDLAFILARHAAAAAEGTALLWQPPRRWKDPERRYPPFVLDFSNGKFLLQAAADPALAGAELFSIDGVRTAEFLRPALERIPAVSDRHRNAVFCRDQAYWWDFAGLLGGKPVFTVRLLAGGGARSARLEAVTAWEHRRLAPAPHAGRDPFPVLRGAAWLELPPMDYSRAWRRRAAAAFRRLERQKLGDLVLDLRRDDGADPRAPEALLGYLEAYAGRAWLLTGPGTANAAAYFAGRARGLPRVTLAGEAPGGGHRGFVTRRARRLPESGLDFTLPSGAAGQPGAAGELAPDLPVTAELLRPHKGDTRTFLLGRIAAARSGNTGGQPRASVIK